MVFSAGSRSIISLIELGDSYGDGRWMTLILEDDLRSVFEGLGICFNHVSSLS